MRMQESKRQLNVPTRFVLLVLTLLIAACTTLSAPEQQSDTPTQTVDADTPPNPAAEFEKADQECTNKGGEWASYFHGDGADFYLESMRCWSNRPPANALRWRDRGSGVLPYDITVVYDTGTGEITRFYRIDPEAEYEKAKQECADLGGEWVGYLHGDGFRHYTYTKRCWNREERPSGPGDPRWKEPGLLPYDVFVSYSLQTNKVIGYDQIDPDSKEKILDSGRNTSE